MRKSLLLPLALVATLPLALVATPCLAQTAKAPLKIPYARNPNLYPADADAQQEIAQTLSEAGKEGKRVIVVFGANWCGDCYALDYGFHQPRIEPLVNGNFKVVHVDVGRFDKNLDLAKKYQLDLKKGIPSLAVVSPAGKVLYASSEFERARAMTEEDIIEFLNAWKPAAVAK